MCSPSDKELFKLRAREYELALKEADKNLIVASNVMAPLSPAVAPRGAALLDVGHEQSHLWGVF